MNTTLLLSILFCALSTGIIAFITLLSKKKDDSRFEKITGISSNPYIFSLKKDDKNELKRISENMGITFVDNSIVMSPTKLKLSLSLKDIEAKER